MIGDKYYKKSNIVESVLIQNTKLLLWEIVDINDTGNGFVTCDLETDDPKIEGKKLRITANHDNMTHRYIAQENFAEIMETILEVQDGVADNIEKIKAQILKN